MTFEHAREVTARLREEGPQEIDGVTIGLHDDEAICPFCRLAFFVGERAFSWGLCPDCLTELTAVPVRYVLGVPPPL